MKIAVITGSAGLIGAEAVRFFSEKGFSAIADRIESVLADANEVIVDVGGFTEGLSALRTLVELRTDVLVAGGGLAGVCAAISAARHGPKWCWCKTGRVSAATVRRRSRCTSSAPLATRAVRDGEKPA